MYAAERLTEAGERSRVAERHALWALALAERDRESSDLDLEAANLRIALDDLVARDATDALRLCVALWPFWLRRIELAEGRRRFDDALAAAPEPTAIRAQALFAAAAIDLRAGTLEHAVEHAEQSLAVAAAIGDWRAEWRAIQLLGGTAVAYDDADDAAAWFDRGLELARRERFAAGAAVGVYSLGVAACVRGDLAEAEELWDRSVELFRALVDSDERILAPTNVAEMLTTDAPGGPGVRSVFEETLQPFVEIGCDAAVGYVLANEAGIVRTRGDLERARALLDESDACFVRANDERGRADVLVRRAYLELAGGATEAAKSHLEHALEQRRALNDRRGVGLVLQGLGLLATIAGEYAAADAQLTEARDLFRRAGDRWGLATTLWRTADLALAL
jgi:tetratricopeptide (TPR) repeat protein